MPLYSSPSSKRPVERRAAHVQKVGHILAGFAFVDQLPGVGNLLGGKFYFPTKLHGGGAIDQLYKINTTTGAATNLGSTGVTGIAGSAIVDGDLELFQYHWSGATDYIYSAALGWTNFTASALLETQIVDGGTPL